MSLFRFVMLSCPSCLYVLARDFSVPYTNSGSSLSLDSVKFVHVFASVNRCRSLLCRRMFSCFESALLEPQKSEWSGCPLRHLKRACGLPLLQALSVRNQNGLVVHRGA